MAPVLPLVKICHSGHEPSGSVDGLKVHSLWVLEHSEVFGWLDIVVNDQEPILAD